MSFFAFLIGLAVGIVLMCFVPASIFAKIQEKVKELFRRK